MILYNVFYTIYNASNITFVLINCSILHKYVMFYRNHIWRNCRAT